MMNLSPKSMRFIAEALEYRIAAYQAQLDKENLDEDEASDLTNDLMFLDSLLQDFKKALEVPVPQVFLA